MLARIMALLKHIPTTAYLIAALLTAAGGWLALNNAHQRQLGAVNVLLAQSKAEGKAAAHRADSLAKAYKPQAAAAVKWRTKWDSTGLRQLQATLDSLQALGVPKPETATVKTTVGTLVTGNTAITTCTQARQTCDEAVGAERARTKAAQADAKLWKAQIPSAFAPWRQRAIGALVGAAVVCLKTNCLK